MNLFCNHIWENLSETTTESKVEVARRCGMSLKAPNLYSFKEITERKVIQIMSCKKCGKLKRFVTEI